MDDMIKSVPACGRIELLDHFVVLWEGTSAYRHAFAKAFVTNFDLNRMEWWVMSSHVANCCFRVPRACDWCDEHRWLWLWWWITLSQRSCKLIDGTIFFSTCSIRLFKFCARGFPPKKKKHHNHINYSIVEQFKNYFPRFPSHFNHLLFVPTHSAHIYTLICSHMSQKIDRRHITYAYRTPMMYISSNITDKL